MNLDYLPLPLTVVVQRASDTETDVPWPESTFIATTPNYPGLSGLAFNPAEATDDLCIAVMQSLPMPDSVADALRDAGYGTDVVQAWDRVSQLSENPHYRHDPQTAVEALGEYASAGIPPMAACEFFPLAPHWAAQVQEAGCTPRDVRAYEQMRSVGRDFDPAFDAMEWLIAGVPAERGELYVGHCSVEQASAWDEYAQTHGLSDDDLRDSVQIGISPEEVAAGFPVHRAAMYAECVAPWQNAVAWEALAAQQGISDDNLLGLFRIFTEPRDVVPDFPFDKAAFYAGCAATPEVVMTWEHAMLRCDAAVDESDLRDILAAGLEPECLIERVAAGDDDPGFSLGQSARMLLALTPGEKSGAGAGA